MPKPHPTPPAPLVTNAGCYSSPGAPYAPHPSLLTVHPLFPATRVRGSRPVHRRHERPRTYEHQPPTNDETAYANGDATHARPAKQTCPVAVYDHQTSPKTDTQYRQDHKR